jgi:hypothetical protein
MTVYKVVTVDKDGRRWGAYNFLGDAVKVEYIPDTIIKPKVLNSFLYVFPTEHLTKDWQRKDTEVWECECPVMQLLVESVLLPTDEELIAFWNKQKEIVANGKKYPIVTDSRMFWGTPELKMVKRVV